MNQQENVLKEYCSLNHKEMERVCDIRHLEIERRFGEMKTLLYSILGACILNPILISVIVRYIDK